jgi:branched-chain amino acid transport system substrate-binding protein
MSSRRKFVFRAAALAATIAAAALVSPLAVDTASAQSKDPIKIGFSMALTGPLGAGGKSALIAMEIWRADINKAGGLMGRAVDFVYYDDATAPAKVPGIYTKLLNVDKVDLVVSSYGTDVIAPAMPIVMREGRVFLTLFGLDVNSKFNYDRYFQIMPAGPDPANDWSKGFIGLAKERGLTKIAIAGADAEFAQNAVKGARHNAQQQGMEIVYDKSFPPSTADFAPILRAIQATNPEVIYFGSYPPNSVGIVKAANELGLKAKLVGGGMVGLQFASIMQNLGPMLNGIVNYDFWVPAKTLNFPGVNEFLEKYRAAAAGQGVDPLGHYLPPYAYAYLQVLGDAVNATQSLDDKVLADYIHKTTFNTVVGPVTFGANGEWAQSRALMVQFRDVKPNNLDQFHDENTRVIVSPESVKTGDLAFPYKQ